MSKSHSLLLALAVLLGTLALACEEYPRSLEVTGPSSLTYTKTGSFTATIKGVYPYIGTASVFWYIDTNNDDIPQTSETLQFTTIAGDNNATAVSSFLWSPSSGLAGQDVTLKVLVGLLDPGSDAYTFLDDTHTVSVTN